MPSGPASAFWHPFADMSTVAGHDFVIASGSGCHVTAEDGREYLDATAALWFCNVGHGRHEIGEAVLRQMSSIAAYSNFGDLATRSTLELADRLSALAPMADAKVFFTSGGSDAVDTALKLVRRYWSVLGQLERTTVVPRHAPGGHLPCGHPGEPRRARAARRRRRQRGVGRRGGAGSAHR
jgi:adenosylmethionine-8-amino-7-oxononanoate aminotransferase